MHCSVQSDQPTADGEAGGAGTRRDAELRIDVDQVPAHGGRAQAQPGRDLAVMQAFGHQPEHVAFSRAQAGRAGTCSGSASHKKRSMTSVTACESPL